MRDITRSRKKLSILLVIVIVSTFVFVPAVLAWQITSITHTFYINPPDQSFHNAILTRRCITAQYHWLTSARLSPDPAPFGPWKYGAINGCVSHYPIIDLTNQVVKICVGASDTDPGSGSVLYEHDNNRCYVCTRWNGGTGNGIDCTEVFNIYGRVTDSGNNNAGLGGVTISDNAGHTTVTDVNGNYSFVNLNAGVYTLTPSKSGYTFSSPLSVSGGPPYNVRGQNFVGTPVPPPDTTKPDGTITSPSNWAVIGPSDSVDFSVDAWDNTGGSGVNRVEFWAKYNNTWHWLDQDSTSPYNIQWKPPQSLRSQILRFTTHVFDNASNEAIDPGGYRYVIFLESLRNPTVNENWVPQNKRFYLNQRSLPNGDAKCSVASMSMVLAMNGLITSDYDTMAVKANAMYPNVLSGNTAYVYKMRDELRRQGAISDYHGVSDINGWKLIKQEIDAGRPLIVRTVDMTTYGHFIVAVGYRESGTEYTVIAYDPYGQWKGTRDRYDRNSTDSDSHKGQWVFYNYKTIFGSNNYLITAKKPSQATAAFNVLTELTPPDEMSDEPEDIVTFEGVESGINVMIYLPLVLR